MIDPLREAYEQSLATTRALAVLMRERAVDRIMAAVRGEPCSAYQFTAQRHCGGIATDGDDPPSRSL